MMQLTFGMIIDELNSNENGLKLNFYLYNTLYTSLLLCTKDTTLQLKPLIGFVHRTKTCQILLFKQLSTFLCLRNQQKFSLQLL